VLGVTCEGVFMGYHSLMTFPTSAGEDYFFVWPLHAVWRIACIFWRRFFAAFPWADCSSVSDNCRSLSLFLGQIFGHAS
jgi:hypothetical protein